MHCLLQYLEVVEIPYQHIGSAHRHVGLCVEACNWTPLRKTGNGGLTAPSFFANIGLTVCLEMLALSADPDSRGLCHDASSV